MLLFALLGCFNDVNDVNGSEGPSEGQCDAYPAPQFHIHVVDESGAPLVADSAWAVDVDGTQYEAACDDDACTDWSGIANDGAVTLYAELDGVTSDPVEDEIIRDDESCTVEEADATVVLSG